MPLPPDVLGILVDIEGTTTPIAFVYDTLFPFAREHLEESCARAGDDPRIQDALRLLREEHAAESTESFDGAAYARALMDQDRKSTGLKALQGVIWEEGYRSGKLKAQVFPDVPPALFAWRAGGVRLRVFSSGSVLAQQQLFGHTEFGDLNPLFEGYHDTTTGPKREARSYRAIAEAFALEPAKLLYLSDVVEELDPAREAGLRTGLLVRPGNRPADPGTHPVYDDFTALFA